MPRERRPRQSAIARNANQSTFGTRPAQTARVTRSTSRRGRTSSNSNLSMMSTSAAAEQIEFSQLFPVFHSHSLNEDVHMVDEQAMAKKLRSYIDAALNQGKQPVVGQNKFADFYVHVKEMVEHSSQADVYKVVGDCICLHFREIASRFTAGYSSIDNFALVQTMIDFHSAFFSSKLPYLAAVLAFAERRAVLNPAKPVLLSELCNLTFQKCFLNQEPMKQSIMEVIVLFFTRMRNCYTEKLLSNASHYQEKADDYKSYMTAWSNQLQSAALVVNLVKMLVTLDRAKLSVFYNFVLLPLVKRSINYGRLLASEQLMKMQHQQPEKTVNDYLHWLTNYLKTDRYLLVEVFGFPSKSAEMMSAILCHVMGSMQMNAYIIGHPKSGFKALFTSESVQEMATLYSLLLGLYELTKQAALLDSVTHCIEQHFEHFQSVFYANHHLITRNDQMAFVQDLLMLKNKWNRVFIKGLSTFADGMPIMNAFKKVWHRFMFNILQHHEAVPLALAFFMHSLFLKSTNIVTNSLREVNQQSLVGQVSPPSLKNKLGSLSEKQNERIDVLIALLGVLQHMKDVNNFYDYCKYYFCSRLLHPSASVFSTAQELIYFDALVAEIKRIFVNNPYMPMDGSSAELQHKQFTQSLGDFDVIANSWRISGTYKLKTRQIRICQLANWKLLPFERCLLPQALENDFKKVEEVYQTKYKSRKLLLNTNLGRATIEVKLPLSGEPVRLTVSLHQLAILQQFNAVQPNVPISYEQLFKAGHFMAENSAKLAILSLVYCDLLKVSRASVGSSLKFEVDENFYNQKVADADRQSGTVDLSSLEQINYWTNESTMNLKTTGCMKALGIADVDIVMASTIKSVEDVRGNYAFLLLNQLKNARADKSSNTASAETAPKLPKTGDSSADREMKIEAAIARVIKRAGHQVSMQEIFSATKAELFVTSRVPFSSTDVLTKEEVSTWALKLVEKNIVKRTNNGKFAFNLD